MRKNLRTKILSTILTIGVLSTNSTVFANSGGTVDNEGDYVGNNSPSNSTIYIDNGYTGNVYGGKADSGEIINNKIFISGSTITGDVYGGKVVSNGSVKKNYISIDNSTILGTIRVGEAEEVTENEVNISNSTIESKDAPIYFAWGKSNASNNVVNIISSTVIANEIYIGYSQMGNTTDNELNISGGKIIVSVRLGMSFLGAVKNNKIKISGTADLTEAELISTPVSNGLSSNNKLIIDGWSGSVGSLKNFDFIDFENIDISKNTSLTSDNISFINTPTITIKSIKADDLKLSAGDYKKDSKINISNISWSAGLGNNVMVDGSVNETLSALSDYYTTDNADNGIYVNKFKLNHEIDKENYQVNFSANVDKSILTGKFIDKNGAHFNSKQTEETAALTIGEGFTTNVGTVAGVYAVDGNNATDGKLIISGNTTYGKDLYGAYAENGNAENSTVEISGNTDYSGTVYAGYSESGAVNGNKINVAANTKAQNMNLSGYNTSGTGNELNISGNGSTFNEINNFKTINFNKVALNEAAAINVQKANLTDTTTINVNSFADGQIYHGGESVTLLKSAKAITGAENVTINNDIVPTGLVQNLHISTAQSADNTSIDLYVKDVSMNSQINLVAENRAVAAAFINQGTDLISDSLDTLSRDDAYGVKTFAAVHGNRSKYDVNSDLKINGWSTIVGVGNAAEFADGDEFSWGVFYENGSGNYRTYNEFNNEFFRGDGSLVYNGGGIAARYENANGVYTEGSLRAGMLKSDMDNALRDGNGNYYGYDSESAYYGAHIGVGKIISLSESSDLDVYGKFFHTYTEGDSFTVANDKFEFDSITSDRLRLGARVTTNKENAFSTYYGLAYEYEFNGDADMRAQNLAAPTQSLQGSSYMAELGFNYQPTPDSPWSFDLNLRGYAGEREGGSFNVQATYTF